MFSCVAACARIRAMDLHQWNGARRNRMALTNVGAMFVGDIVRDEKEQPWNLA